MCTTAILTESVRAVENRCKKAQAQLLAFLLPPLVGGRPRFRLVALVSSVGLTVGLTIGGAVSTGEEVAVGLSGLSYARR